MHKESHTDTDATEILTYPITRTVAKDKGLHLAVKDKHKVLL